MITHTAPIVTLALPSKGAISEPTLGFLRDCGLKVDKPNQRQYIGYLPAIPAIQVLFQRVTDILYKVADGTAQIGITGLDVVRENPDENLVVIHDQLGYGQCSLVVAIPETWVDVENMTDLMDVAMDFREQKRRNLRIATKYPTLTRQFLYKQGLHHFTLVKAEGAIEAAPTLGYADIIVDLTQTGTTLRENHLKILADGFIIDSQACLIGNRQAIKNDANIRDTVGVLLEYIDAATNGHNYYQIIANIKGQNAEDVAHKVALNPLTRGLQGPTISPLYSSNGTTDADGLWYTATIIIKSRDLLDAVKHLRSIGGTQTIVTPVRYIFMEVSSSFARLLEELNLEK
jgi:ATP phosphoribosyltransferase